ncbi:unnamed protein product [Clavelina lepadiformis]|uniref:Uncharacterized protein n=1 Tax=Clavelina lepadiformis TaxID=159417 RepID=A0ABP0F086_CLALP
MTLLRHRKGFHILQGVTTWHYTGSNKKLSNRAPAEIKQVLSVNLPKKKIRKEENALTLATTFTFGLPLS